MTSRETGLPVWHGRTQGTITERMAKNPDETARDAVASILGSVPPRRSR